MTNHQDSSGRLARRGVAGRASGLDARPSLSRRQRRDEAPREECGRERRIAHRKCDHQPATRRPQGQPMPILVGIQLLASPMHREVSVERLREPSGEEFFLSPGRMPSSARIAVWPQYDSDWTRVSRRQIAGRRHGTTNAPSVQLLPLAQETRPLDLAAPRVRIMASLLSQHEGFAPSCLSILHPRCRSRR